MCSPDIQSFRSSNSRLRLASIFVALWLAANSNPAFSSTYNYYNVPNDDARVYVDQVIGVHYTRAYENFARNSSSSNNGAWGELDYVLQRVPNHPASLLLLIQLMRELPSTAPDLVLKLDQAKKYFQNALQIDPKQADTHVLYGMFLQIDATTLSQAIEEYETAIQLNPRNADAYYNLGLALVTRQDYEKAVIAAKKAYALGHPLPGLRNKLQAANAWK